MNLETFSEALKEKAKKATLQNVSFERLKRGLYCIRFSFGYSAVLRIEVDVHPSTTELRFNETRYTRVEGKITISVEGTDLIWFHQLNEP